MIPGHLDTGMERCRDAARRQAGEMIDYDGLVRFRRAGSRRYIEKGVRARPDALSTLIEAQPKPMNRADLADRVRMPATSCSVST
jgi:hypothetical protein